MPHWLDVTCFVCPGEIYFLWLYIYTAKYLIMVSTHFTDLSKHTIAYSEIDYVASLRVISQKMLSQKTLHKIKE